MRVDRAILSVMFSLAGCGPALAAPLEPEACATLKAEHRGLVADGAKSDMDRGPEWAKSNLTPDRLGKIERLIAVEEQLSFRCGEGLTARPAIRELPKTEGGDPAKAAAGESPGAAVSATREAGRGTPSNIPPPKRKDAAKAAKTQTATH